MNKEWQKYLDMASGVREATQKRAESIVRTLVKQGEIATDRAEKAVDELLSRSESNRKAIASIVRSETEKAVDRLGLVRKKDLRALERKIDKLEGSTGAVRKSSKKSSKKSTKAPPVKASKKATKKSAAAKRAARKTAAKKTQQRARPPKKTAPPSSPTSDTP